MSSEDDHLCRKEPGARGVEKILVSSWDRRRDRGTWEEEQVDPEVLKGPKWGLCKMAQPPLNGKHPLMGKPGSERSQGELLVPHLSFPYSLWALQTRAREWGLGGWG